MPMNRAALPAYSKLAADRAALGAAYLAAAGLVALLVMPLIVGLAAVAPMVVAVLLGPKWYEVGPLISLLTFHGLVDRFLRAAASGGLAGARPASGGHRLGAAVGGGGHVRHDGAGTAVDRRGDADAGPQPDAARGVRTSGRGNLYRGRALGLAPVRPAVRCRDHARRAGGGLLAANDGARGGVVSQEARAALDRELVSG